MAADDREPDRDVAGPQMIVGVTHARRGEPDENLAGLRRVEFEFRDLPVLADIPEHRCLRLHANTSFASASRGWCSQPCRSGARPRCRSVRAWRRRWVTGPA